MTTTKGWKLGRIVEQGDNFRHVERVSATAPDLLDKIKDYEANGVPLVIEGFHKHPKWPQHTFTIDQFVETYDGADIKVRNVHNRLDSTLPLRDFIGKCRILPQYTTDTETERFYGKDIECPKHWDDWLQKGELIPKVLVNKGPEDVFRHLPNTAENAVETLMCYIGIGDTFTPCHKDLCASSGQNLMCYTENGGSSFWFMTASSSAHLAANFFQDQLGRELDHESYFVTVEELSRAPFEVYVIEQKLGDMVLVPPRSCHQVINHKGITFKTSWSRMTTKGLRTAFFHELPMYRRVCRPEIYQIKSTTYHSLLALTTELERNISRSSDGHGHILEELKELLLLYEAILTEEYDEDFAKETPSEDDGYRRTCDFCQAEIFQSYFECSECCESSDDLLHLCIGCYVEGRRCPCSIAMKPMQTRDFKVLRQAGDNALRVIKAYENRFNRKSTISAELKSVRDDFPQLFRAGCMLYRVIQAPLLPRQKKVRTCDIRRATARSTHASDGWNLLFCKKCKFPTCYEHILSEYNTHAVEALLLSAPGEPEALYHANHIRSKTRFEDELKNQELDEVRSRGERPRGCRAPEVYYAMMAQNALKYTQCTPANKILIPGWYDTQRPWKPPLVVKIPPIVSRQKSLQPPNSEAPPSSSAPSPSPLTPLSSIVSLPLETTHGLQVFVEVPKAPYDISRFKRDLSESADNSQNVPLSDTELTDDDSLYARSPKIGPPKRRRTSRPQHMASPRKGVMTRPLNTPPLRIGPPKKHRNARTAPKEEPVVPNKAAENILPPRFSFASKKFPKFKKNLPPTTTDQAAPENTSNPETAPDDAHSQQPQHASPSTPHPQSPATETPPYQSSPKANMFSPSGQAPPTSISPPANYSDSQSHMTNVVVRSTAAAVNAFANVFLSGPVTSSNTPPTSDHQFHQTHAPWHSPVPGPSHPQPFQQFFTPPQPYNQEPPRPQQYAPDASYNVPTTYYNNSYQQVHPPHYYTGQSYSDTPATYTPQPHYNQTPPSYPFYPGHSPQNSAYMAKQPRLERQRWDRDSNEPGPSRGFGRRRTDSFRQHHSPRNGHMYSANHQSPSTTQHRPRQKPYGHFDPRAPHSSSQISRSPMHFERSYPEQYQKHGRPRRRHRAPKDEPHYHDLGHSSGYGGRSQQASRAASRQPEVPMAVDGMPRGNERPPLDESGGGRIADQTGQDAGHGAEDDWEANYEKSEEVEPSASPTFRTQGYDWTQDRRHYDNNNGYDPSVYANPWGQ